MRVIATSAAAVEQLKKQAKRLQRTGGGKHAELLDKVARGAGYLHWHHVLQCVERTQAKRGVDALDAEVEIIQRAARDRVSKAIVTGPELLIPPMLLFAEGGDAWMLDPDENDVLCLAWRGEMQEPMFQDQGQQVAIGWDGAYRLDGEGFFVATTHAQVGTRAIVGYPLPELHALVERTLSMRAKYKALFQPGEASS